MLLTSQIQEASGGTWNNTGGVLLFGSRVDMSLTYSIDENFDLAKIEPRFQNIFELAIPFLQTRLNLPHTYIVYQYAQLLLKEEGGQRR
jgi:hypothetical protein